MTSAEGPFPEADYLLANPDVGEAVRSGAFQSGEQHWLAFGHTEGRPLRTAYGPFSARREKLLGDLDIPHLTGMEIGALNAPLLTKDQGHIAYVDYLDTESLRRKHQGCAVETATLVEVDHVWGKNTLQACLGDSHKVDYVLASHVIEHVPDMVGWLAEIAAVLAPTGELRLAVPDRRFTFDILRRESTLAELLDAFVCHARVPSARAIFDNHLNYTIITAEQIWRDGFRIETVRPLLSPAQAFESGREAVRSGEYHDLHCWVFTPRSFAALGLQLAELGLLPFACVRIYPTERGEIEFIARLRLCADPAACVTSWAAETARLRSDDPG